MKRTAAAARTERLLRKLDTSKKKSKDCVLVTYSRVVNHVMETYVADNVTAETHNDIL